MGTNIYTIDGENGTPVLSLTEKDSGWGLAILAENIELVEEMR